MSDQSSPLAPPDPPPGGGAAGIVVQRRIEWWDTDASGNFHNTAVSRLLETAETLLLARLGILHDVYDRLPRVRFEADYRAPLAFHDLVEVALRVEAIGRSSITYGARISRHGTTCVEARAVAVLLDRPRGRPTSWPREHRELLLTAGQLEPELLTGY